MKETTRRCKIACCSSSMKETTRRYKIACCWSNSVVNSWIEQKVIVVFRMKWSIASKDIHHSKKRFFTIFFMMCFIMSSNWCISYQIQTKIYSLCIALSQVTLPPTWLLMLWVPLKVKPSRRTFQSGQSIFKKDIIIQNMRLPMCQMNIESSATCRLIMFQCMDGG